MKEECSMPVTHSLRVNAGQVVRDQVNRKASQLQSRWRNFPRVPGEGRTKLYCKACREELSLKRNIIVSYVSSAKHKTGKD